MNAMKLKAVLCSALLFVVAVSLYGHDLFLKLTSHYLEPHQQAVIALYNGTFDQSENVITRDRMVDVSIVGPEDEVEHPDTSDWWEKDDATWLDFETGTEGTYLIGVSTRSRVIELSAEDFDAYLSHDGVLDVLEARRQSGPHTEPVMERYSKHVKAIYQVGDRRTDAFARRLGYPIEIVPLSNPYEIKAGEGLDVLVLRAGEPVADQLVYASYEGYHSHDPDGGHVESFVTRTDARGIARIEVTAAAKWYVRLIHMTESDEDEVDYESQWATMTFEVR